MKWIFLALLTSLFWGIYVVLLKIVMPKMSLSAIMLSLSFGVLIVSAISVAFSPIKTQQEAFLISVFAGMLWALGIFFVLLAIEKGAEVARLAPIYNTNTLIAFFLGIILLKEIPSGNELLKALIGAILIVIGAILVA